MRADLGWYALSSMSQCDAEEQKTCTGLALRRALPWSLPGTPVFYGYLAAESSAMVSAALRNLKVVEVFFVNWNVATLLFRLGCTAGLWGRRPSKS